MDTQSWIGIPYVIWSAIIASGLTLLGVLLSNSNSRKQLEMKLVHDGKQQDKEREMSIKREVYIEGSKAISEGMSILMSLSDINIQNHEFQSTYKIDFASIDKIQLVGKNSTVQAILHFTNSLSSAYLDIFLQRIDLTNRKSQIETIQSLRDKMLEKHGVFVDLMTQHNIDGSEDTIKFKILDNNASFQMEQYEKYVNELKPLFENQQTEILQFVGYCFEKHSEISKLIPPILFSIRDEMELPIDEEQYASEYEKHIQVSKEIAKNFLDAIRQKSPTR